MNVNANIFEYFYDKLYDTVFERVFKRKYPENYNGRGDRSPEMWEIIPKSEKIDFTGKKTSSPLYFHERVQFLNKYGGGYVDDKSFYKGLAYLRGNSLSHTIGKMTLKHYIRNLKLKPLTQLKMQERTTLLKNQSLVPIQ